MKKLSSVLIAVIFTILFSGCATTNPEPQQTLKVIQPLDISKRKTMAVIPYDFKDNNTSYEGLESGLVDLTINSFFETKRFLLVERTKLKAVVQELQYSSSGMVDTENALKIGKHAGAEYVFIGAVTSINPIAKKHTIGIAYIDTKGFEVTIQGRIIDIEKGVVVASTTAKGKEEKTKKVALGATTGSIAPDDTLIRMAFEKAVQLLANDLASQL
ncbi:MAG: hypothetical protein C0602_12680 [Denitrovibrio sp.]|nr:MAG: hypothetical protein C0602_12680 [Denitrovibrio sp.]